MLAAPQPGVIVSELRTVEGALGWFAEEQATLLAAVRWAAESACGSYTWRIEWTLSTFLGRLTTMSKPSRALVAAA
jgi:hypothetical protein